MAFFKLRLPGRFSSTQTGADALSNAPAESVEVIRKRARHRLMGSVVLVLGAVVGLPLLFDSQPRPVAIDTPIVIPDRNQTSPLSATAGSAKTGAGKEALAPDQTMRVFPISDWTEFDIWAYIEEFDVPVNPLYFAKERPVVFRGEQMIMVDDERYPLLPDETPELRRIRFRTLGCYPLTAAVESQATTVSEVLEEVGLVKLSERATRLIDGEAEDSMEKKKTEGYF